MKILDLINKYKNNKLAKGSITFLIIKMIAMAFGYINIIIITKYFGTSALGIFSYLVSVLTFIAAFSGLGIEMATLRFVSKFKAKNEFGKIKSYYFQALKIIFIPGILLSLVFFVFPEFIALKIFGKPENAVYMRYLAFLLLPISIHKINNQFLRAYKKIGQFAFVKLFFTPITVVILFFIVVFTPIRSEKIPITVHFVSLFVMFIISFLLIFYLKNWKTAKISESVKIKDILKVSFPMMFIVITGAISKQADKIILGYFVSNSDIGIYHAMNKTALLINIVLLSANSGLAPRFSELFELKRFKELKKLAHKSSKYITLLSFIVFLLILVFSKYIINFLGIDYKIGIQLLVIMSVAQMFSAWIGPVGSFLLMTGNEKINKNVSLTIAGLFIFFNIILVYFYGILGSAIATSLVIVIKNIIFVVIVKRKHNLLFLYLPKFARKIVDDW